MKKIFLIILTLIATPNYANAMSCAQQDDKVKEYPVIFKGTVISTEEIKNVTAQPRSPLEGVSANTSFKILETYKGNIKDITIIKHTIKSPIGGGATTYKAGETYLIYARESEGKDHYLVGGCTPRLIISSLKKYMDKRLISNLLELENFKSTTKSYNKLIAQYPNHPLLYLKQAEFYEEYKDYKNALKSYSQGESIWHSTLVKRSTRLTNIPFIIGKGRVLYTQGQFEEALPYLKTVIESRDRQYIAEATQLYNASLIKLEKFEGLKGSIDLSGMKLKNIDLSNLKLSGSNFSNAEIHGLKIHNTDLSNTNFSGSTILNLNIKNSSFEQSNFTKSKIRFNLIDTANFKRADFRESEIYSYYINNGDFTDADLSSSKFVIYLDSKRHKISRSEIPSSAFKLPQNYNNLDFSNANLQNAKIHQLAGIKLKGADLNHIEITSTGGISNFSNVDLSGFDLSGGDFRGTSFRWAKFTETNLSNANLTWSYSTPSDLRDADLSEANLYGAILTFAFYNCKTIFPNNFLPTDQYMIPLWDGCDTPRPAISFSGLSLPPHGIKVPLDNKTDNKKATWGNVPRLLYLDLSGATFEGSEIPEFKCMYCNIKSTNFNNTKMTLNLMGSDLRNATFANTIIDKRSNFAETDLRGVDLSSLTFKKRHSGKDGKYFYQPTISKAKYDSKTIWPEGFDVKDSKAIMVEN